MRAAAEAREATPREEPAPYFTADEKPVGQAVRELRELLDAFVVAAAQGHNPGTVTAIAAAAGIGKTVELLRALLRHRRPGFVAWLSLPTHALCVEIAGKASGLGLRVRVALGRKADPGGTSLCRKPEIVEAVAHASLPVMTSVCRQEVGDGEIRRCEHYASCRYLAQFRPGEIDLVLVPHASLPFLSKLPKVPGELGLPPPSLLVIDERPVDTLLKADQSFTFDQLTAPRGLRDDQEAELRRVVVAVREAIEQGRDPRDAADEGTFTRVAGFEAMPPRQSDIWPSLPADEQRRRALALRSHPRRLIAEFLHILADTKDADRFSRRVEVRLALKGPDGVPRDRVLVHGRDRIDHRDAPVLLLDAAFDARQARTFFPDVKEHVIAVRRNCHVIQVCDNPCSKRRFLGRKDPSEEDLRSAAARREELGWIIEREVEHAEGRGVLVVMPAALERIMPVVPGADLAHYNSLRGLDAYRDHRTVICVSREQLPDRAAEALARALFGDDGAPLDLPGEYGEEIRGYRLRDGSRKGAKVMVHPDHRVQSLVESTREREIEQAVDRLRTVHRVVPARVLILTNVPIDITVDELVRWRDLVPSRIEVAMTRLRAGVLPLNPGWLADQFPDL